jgi:hypothetical protein
MASAYPGETFILWLRGSVIAPLCFFGILGSVLFVCFRPQHAVIVLGATIAALFVMYLMSNGSQVTHQLETAGQG